MVLDIKRTPFQLAPFASPPERPNLPRCRQFAAPHCQRGGAEARVLTHRDREAAEHFCRLHTDRRGAGNAHVRETGYELITLQRRERAKLHHARSGLVARRKFRRRKSGCFLTWPRMRCPSPSGRSRGPGRQEIGPIGARADHPNPSSDGKSKRRANWAAPRTAMCSPRAHLSLKQQPSALRAPRFFTVSSLSAPPSCASSGAGLPSPSATSNMV